MEEDTPEETRRPSAEEKPMWDAVCSKCGQACKVPFEPAPDRPVYCRDCYRPKKRRF